MKNHYHVAQAERHLTSNYSENKAIICQPDTVNSQRHSGQLSAKPAWPKVVHSALTVSLWKDSN